MFFPESFFYVFFFTINFLQHADNFNNNNKL